MTRSLILLLMWLSEINLSVSDPKGYDYFNFFYTEPKFRNDGGHLYIVGALGHDVIILTQGNGKLKINDEDLLQVFKTVRTAAATVQKFESSTWKEMESSFRAVKKAINDPGGLLKRIQLLEEFNNRTETQESFAVLKWNVRRLQSRMSRSDTQIRNLEELMVTDDCKSDPCQNGGTCTDMYNGFICRCPDGWEGKTCGSDVDECQRFAGTSLGCGNGATCLNTAGSYKCQCPQGWYGLHCTLETVRCSRASEPELCGHGTCVAQPGTATGFICICDPGWTSDGTSASCTLDRNECSELQATCSRDPPVTCINTPGSFHCSSCPQGYTGNGFHCVDIDECLVGNGGCSTNPRVQCINTKGSRACGSCPPGYQGDGTICTYAGGLCMVNNGGCHPRATCTQNIGLNYVQCTCPAGWVGNGIGEIGCQPVRTACESNPCNNGATCVSSSTTSFTCQCAAGFSGETCSGSVCSPNPCLNGGECRVTQTSHSVSYFCLCPGEYSGVNCEIGAESPIVSVGCGGYISGLSGSLVWPSNVSTEIRPGGVECEWTIVSSNSSLALNLTFVEYQIKNPQASCMSNYFDIYDGSTGKEHFHRIGRYCDTSKPRSIVTSQSSVRLKYVSGSLNANFRLNWTAVQPSCGGTYAVGGPTSISYPTSGTTSLNKDCYWRLQAPLGKRIRILFFTMVFPAHPECDDGFLEVRDGESLDSPVLVKYCNQTSPSTSVITTSSTATVHCFAKDVTKQIRFRIVHSSVEGDPGCGGVVSGPSGTITAPGSERYYRGNLNCEWKIQLPLNEKIKLKFDKFNIESSKQCKYDYVKVYDGPTVESGLVGKWCGDNVPATFVSSTNTLTIVFKSDSSYNEGQLKMSFTTVCGGTFTSAAGFIHSPNYPVHYTENRVCAYTIAQPLGRGITLNFLDFDLESNVESKECGSFDYIKIYDGHNDEAPLLGSYCGIHYPQLTISTYNYLHIVFRTDHATNGRGFHANYSSFEIGCGGILKNESGTISSPKYPQEYPTSKDCTWYIQGKEGHLIQLNWLAFNVEQSLDCRQDWVQMYSTAVSQENMMGERYCGDRLPPSLTSLSNIVIIIFHSDGSASEPGFRLNYNTSPKAQNCGGNFYSTMGTVTSPNYPNNYPTSVTCAWVINVPHGQQIQLFVESFKLEQQMQCASDFLEIRNGGYPTSPLIKRYCNDVIDEEIISFTNQLYLKFVSGPSITDSGFHITWRGASRGCGGTLTSAAGSIISPNYPQTYGKNGECYWRISVSMGSVIQLTVADLDLEYHSLCLLDYIEIFDGTDKRAPSLGRFCSLDNIVPITSKTNHVFIRFRSDMSKEGRGFHLTYITVCNRTITGFSGVIESPNFPEAESPISECLWKIIAPPGNKINITFSHFSVFVPPVVYMERKNCTHAFLEINEGEGSAASGQLGKFCGDQIPSRIQSSLNNVYIHLKGSQVITSISIFRLEWMIYGCGGVFDNKLNGHFNSPGYPALYGHSLFCEWYISVPNGKSIEITVQDIHMENIIGCNADALSIYGGPDDSAPLLSKMCSSISEPSVYTTSGNYAFIRFKSDRTRTGRGFAVSFKAIDGECGGSYVGERGNVHSHNYPQNYDPHDDCVYRIRAVKNHRVVLTFKEFDIAPTLPNCTQGFVKVYDGNSFDSPVLMTQCGNRIPEPVKSSNNEILIRHKADGFNTAKGFSASFQPMCGAIIVTNGSGTIEHHEGQLHSLAEYVNCSWSIKASDLKAKISLTFVTLHIGSDEDKANKIEIYAGEDTSSPLVATIDGHIAPPAITVPSSVALIVFKPSFFSNIFGHIILDYSVLDAVCGGSLSSEHGNFVSPNYPDSYPINAECVWTLKISPGNMISLTFPVFELPLTDACNEDYVEIRERDADGKLLGVYCGDSAPTNVSVTSHIWVKFRSSSDPQYVKGFMAYFSLVRDIELTGTNGSIASPLYPMPYEGENEFNWRISVALGNVIKITVKDVTGEVDDIFGCTNEVDVYDGYDSSAPRLLSACSVDIPEPETSTGNVVYLRFKSRAGAFGYSFLLDWEEVSESASETTVKKEDSCMTRVTLSGERGKNNSYNFTSPGFPNGYNHNLDCLWVFETVPENHLVIDFKIVYIETSSQCQADYIKIFSPGSTTEWEEKYSLCNWNSTEYPIKVGNVAKIIFKTDYYYSRTGFSGVVSSVCGGSVVSRPSGVLTNKGWGLATCKWDVTVSSGRTINVNFTYFNLRQTPGESSCEKNYIIIRNGGSESSPFLGAGKYCGTTPPIVPESTSNKLYIEVVVDSVEQEMELIYKEVSVDCGEDIRLVRKNSVAVITSPNYPNISPSHIECSWRIMAPTGKSIHFDIADSFEMHTSRGCTKEYIELRDGATDLSPLIGRFCSFPLYQVTKGNALYVKYFTDVNDPGESFRARISVSECGGTIYDSTTGKIESPGYPYSYDSNIACEWRLIAAESFRYVLTFKTFNLEPQTSHCNDSVDTLTIMDFDLVQIQGSEPSVYCGRNNSGVTYQSAGHKLVIKFKSVMQPKLSERRSFSIEYRAERTGCGGRFTLPSADIMSPGYPGHSRGNFFCIWRIAVQNDRRVTFTLKDLDLEFNPSNVSSGTHGIDFYNSFDFSDSIASWYGQKPSGTTIESSGSKMMIHYYSMYENSHRGFSGTYTSDKPAECGGYLSGTGGTVRVPSADLGSTFYCEWEHEGTFLNKDTFSLQIVGTVGSLTEAECALSRVSHSRVTILIGSDDMMFCSKATPASPFWVIGPHHGVHIEVYSSMKGADNDSTPMNFTISWKVNECGGLMKMSSSVITSPNFPKSYPNDIDCVWLIEFPQGSTIKVHFESFNLENNCDNDYLIVRNGRKLSSPEIGKFCGSVVPADVITQSNYVWVSFHSDHAKAESGFKINFTPVTQGCGGIYHDQKGRLQTPNYPSSYENNIECDWEIRVDPGFHIELKLMGRFYLEDSPGCVKDFLEVSDFLGGKWKTIGRVCGRSPQLVFNTTSNRMRVFFRSDDKVRADGFMAMWSSACGGLIEAKGAGKIFSPGYPNSPSHGPWNCNYTVISPGSFLFVRFNAFHLEKAGPSGCTSDRLIIFLADYTGLYEPLETFCGSSVPNSFTSRNKFGLHFISSSGTSNAGFEVSYDMEVCGGTITTETMISPPMVDGEAFLNMKCVWDIIAPENYTIVIKFSELRIPLTSECDQDYLLVYDTARNGSQLMGRICGYFIGRPPPVFRTSGSSAKLIFVTYIYRSEGFSAKVSFRRGCGGLINVTGKTTLSSPDFDGDGKYDRMLDCHWSLRAPPQETILLRIRSFNISSCRNSTASRNCTCDYLQIFDGPSENDELIGRFCGDNFPQIVSSSDRYLSMTLTTDGTEEGKGFEIEAESVVSQCGPSILNATDEPQELTSPGYPNNYPDNIHCLWFIADTGTDLDIHFEYLNLEPSAMCSADRLEITTISRTPFIDEGFGGDRKIFIGESAWDFYIPSVNMVSRMPTTKSIFCGVGQPLDFYSSSRHIQIRFISDSKTTAKGFQLTYSIAICNRNYTAAQGRVVKTALKGDCQVSISVPEPNATISLYFLVVLQSSGCGNAKLHVHDGPTEASPRLLTFCGTGTPSPVFSTGPNLLVKYTTNSEFPQRGSFDFTYTTTTKGRGCGGSIFNYVGAFSSPNYPGNYRNDSICRWDISVPTGNVPVIGFTTFDFGSSTCDQDYLELYDVDPSNNLETLRTKYCGTEKPAKFTGKTGLVAVRYKTSVHNSGVGWDARFISVLAPDMSD